MHASRHVHLLWWQCSLPSQTNKKRTYFTKGLCWNDPSKHIGHWWWRYSVGLPSVCITSWPLVGICCSPLKSEGIAPITMDNITEHILHACIPDSWHMCCHATSTSCWTEAFTASSRTTNYWRAAPKCLWRLVYSTNFYKIEQVSHAEMPTFVLSLNPRLARVASNVSHHTVTLGAIRTNSSCTNLSMPISTAREGHLVHRETVLGVIKEQGLEYIGRHWSGYYQFQEGG